MKLRIVCSAALITLAAAAFVWYRLPEWSTSYSAPEVKRSFGTVSNGAGLEDLYQRIGVPFYAAVLSNGPRMLVSYDHDVSLQHLSGLMSNAGVTVCLHYSTNNGMSGHYYRYEVELSRGKVVRVLRDLQD